MHKCNMLSLSRSASLPQFYCLSLDFCLSLDLSLRLSISPSICVPRLFVEVVYRIPTSCTLLYVLFSGLFGQFPGPFSGPHFPSLLCFLPVCSHLFSPCSIPFSL
ncbi:hypothetical protein AAMO2058_000322100 [Amorphochlora amoebiformis]